MAKEATVNQVIQEGRGFMDQLERGMTERDGPCSLTQKLCIVMPNINVTHMKTFPDVNFGMCVPAQSLKIIFSRFGLCIRPNLDHFKVDVVLHYPLVKKHCSHLC